MALQGARQRQHPAVCPHGDDQVTAPLGQVDIAFRREQTGFDRKAFAPLRIGRLERTSILHSGKSTLRPAINWASATERSLKMITFFKMNALPYMDSVAFQAAQRALRDTTGAVFFPLMLDMCQNCHRRNIS